MVGGRLRPQVRRAGQDWCLVIICSHVEAFRHFSRVHVASSNWSSRGTVSICLENEIGNLQRLFYDLPARSDCSNVEKAKR